MKIAIDESLRENCRALNSIITPKPQLTESGAETLNPTMLIQILNPFPGQKLRTPGPWHKFVNP